MCVVRFAFVMTVIVYREANGVSLHFSSLIKRKAYISHKTFWQQHTIAMPL